ncbi:MAG: hypothetical protein O7H41_21610 [Planctomycetota bacterium]|nr:hypothetical protein [Planctomycetota bacterium]
MAIPIKNIYYLLCYAWDRMDSRDLVDASALAGHRTENLLAKVLKDGVAHLIRRGLDRGYLPIEEEGRRLRGKLLLTRTVERVLLPSGRVAYQTDELSHDLPHNQVIKGAMRLLMGVPEMDSALRAGLRDHCRRLHDVSDVRLNSAAFRKVQLHRNVARYAFLVNVARLVERSFLPDPMSGRRRFHPFTASRSQMGLLFEAFVLNFLRREQNVFPQVSRAKVPWDLQILETSDLTWLPDMRTDVTLISPERRVVIETKFVAEPYQSYFSSKKLVSGHLYQLLAYLSQMSATEGPRPSGVLLYAGATEIPRLDYRLGGYHLSVRNLDLDREWRQIHEDLLQLVREWELDLAA